MTPSKRITNLLGAWHAQFEVFLHEVTSLLGVNGLEGYYNLWNEKKVKKANEIRTINVTDTLIVYNPAD